MTACIMDDFVTENARCISMGTDIGLFVFVSLFLLITPMDYSE
jgi:hypothetical protein